MSDSNLGIPTEINAIGQPCPMPLLMLKRGLKKADQHQVFLLKSSDPHSEIDVIRYCQLHQLKCQLTRISDHEFHYLIHS
ncbi:sulfurtransferase TusA family protein [Acinetobacter sp. S40]|uniref:sulfurtransferase TusA family protein n=1 Tax=unclassified Acinetobacter TaxID=196816 RepID=UPI00190BF1FD|nr:MULTISPECIES: sulfurtransferase TusA family protein [unclassified Acinetobacter]MBJ9984543.1 sulfurtransferase TusA family protein [Acinetobacter sp. S40]MBK0062260.1 sulfurtransferase TusA family protein [Acinetobacter sp. S55]MBK0066064.1 sulfurtransferase TusA family protein [Acinetobacter sp. S54]